MACTTLATRATAAARAAASSAVGARKRSNSTTSAQARSRVSAAQQRGAQDRPAPGTRHCAGAATGCASAARRPPKAAPAVQRWTARRRAPRAPPPAWQPQGAQVRPATRSPRRLSCWPARSRPHPEPMRVCVLEPLSARWGQVLCCGAHLCGRWEAQWRGGAVRSCWHQWTKPVVAELHHGLHASSPSPPVSLLASAQQRGHPSPCAAQGSQQLR